MSENHEVPVVSLKEEDLLAEAQKRAGCTEWGGYDFKETLRTLLSFIEEEANLSPMGRFLNWRNITRVLTNRLLIEKERASGIYPYPESCDQPLFITGLPRTGTTLLHNLLIQDRSVHYVRLCDGMYPAPAPRPETWSTDPRIEITRKFSDNMFRLRPELKQIHFFGPTSPEECLWLFEHQFLDPVYAARMEMPGYNAWLFQHNHEKSYAEYHEMLNFLAQHFPSRRWVLKAPRHLFFMDSILNEFPNACIVWIHRDPVKVIPSMANMSYMYRQWFSKDTDPKRTGHFHFNGMRKGIEWAMMLREKIPASRIYDLYYDKFMDDPLGCIRKIYNHFNIPFTDAMKAPMRAWLDENPQNKHGKHTYAAEDFGLTDEQIRDSFNDYTDHFSLSPERELKTPVVRRSGTRTSLNRSS